MTDQCCVRLQPLAIKTNNIKSRTLGVGAEQLCLSEGHVHVCVLLLEALRVEALVGDQPVEPARSHRLQKLRGL